MNISGTLVAMAVVLVALVSVLLSPRFSILERFFSTRRTELKRELRTVLSAAQRLFTHALGNVGESFGIKVHCTRRSIVKRQNCWTFHRTVPCIGAVLLAVAWLTLLPSLNRGEDSEQGKRQLGENPEDTRAAAFRFEHKIMDEQGPKGPFGGSRARHWARGPGWRWGPRCGDRGDAPVQAQAGFGVPKRSEGASLDPESPRHDRFPQSASG